MEDERSFGEDESSDPGLPGLGSAHCFPHLNGERVERYSRKVFVGGLPPDIDEGKDWLWLPVKCGGRARILMQGQTPRYTKLQMKF